MSLPTAPVIGRTLSPVFVVGPDTTCVTAVADGLRRCDGVIGFGRPLEVFSEMPGLVDLIANSEALYSPTRQAEAKQHVRNRWEQVVDAKDGPSIGGARLCEEARVAMDDFLARLPSGRWSRGELQTVHDATKRFLHDLSRGHPQWTLGPRILLDQAPFGLLTGRTLMRALPDARFVHVVREPVGFVRALASGVWGPRAIDSATNWSLQYAEAAREAADQLPPERVHQVQWELLQHQDPQAHRALGEFLGLDATATQSLSVAADAGAARGGSVDGAALPDWLWMASPKALEQLASLQQAWGYPVTVGTSKPGPTAWLPRTPSGDHGHHTAS